MLKYQLSCPKWKPRLRSNRLPNPYLGNFLEITRLEFTLKTIHCVHSVSLLPEQTHLPRTLFQVSLLDPKEFSLPLRPAHSILPQLPYKVHYRTRHNLSLIPQEPHLEHHNLQQISTQVVIFPFKLPHLIQKLKVMKRCCDQDPKIQMLDNIGLHFQDLLFGISRIADIDQITNFRNLISFLILSRNPQRHNTHQLQPIPTYLYLPQIQIHNRDPQEESNRLQSILQMYIDKPVQEYGTHMLGYIRLAGEIVRGDGRRGAPMGQISDDLGDIWGLLFWRRGRGLGWRAGWELGLRLGLAGGVGATWGQVLGVGVGNGASGLAVPYALLYKFHIDYFITDKIQRLAIQYFIHTLQGYFCIREEDQIKIQNNRHFMENCILGDP